MNTMKTKGHNSGLWHLVNVIHRWSLFPVQWRNELIIWDVFLWNPVAHWTGSTVPALLETFQLIQFFRHISYLLLHKRPTNKLIKSNGTYMPWRNRCLFLSWANLKYVSDFKHRYLLTTYLHLFIYIYFIYKSLWDNAFKYQNAKCMWHVFHQLLITVHLI